MQKKAKKTLTTCLVILVVVGGIAYAIYWAFFDIQRIHGQEVLAESISPNEEYTVIAYLNSGGATVDNAVLATVVNNLNGHTRNIYWQYHCASAVITWNDNVTVCINGVTLNVLKDSYDYRND